MTFQQSLGGAEALLQAHLTPAM